MHVSRCVAAIYLLEVLEQSREFAIYKKYTWQGASAESAICTARAEGNQAGPRVLLHNVWSLCAAGENNTGGF